MCSDSEGQCPHAELDCLTTVNTIYHISSPYCQCWCGHCRNQCRPQRHTIETLTVLKFKVSLKNKIVFLYYESFNILLLVPQKFPVLGSIICSCCCAGFTFQFNITSLFTKASSTFLWNRAYYLGYIYKFTIT